MCAGDWIFQVLAMHEKYGPVVRVAPDELSFIDSAAWKDIYGHKLGGDFPKAIRLFRGSRKFPVSLLVTEGREEHRTLRRRLAQGFSEQAMRLHGPVIDGYVSLLMTRLLENCNAGKRALDIKEWYSKLDRQLFGS
jgi:cytochrome P450